MKIGVFVVVMAGLGKHTIFVVFVIFVNAILIIHRKYCGIRIIVLTMFLWDTICVYFIILQLDDSQVIIYNEIFMEYIIKWCFHHFKTIFIYLIIILTTNKCDSDDFYSCNLCLISMNKYYLIDNDLTFHIRYSECSVIFQFQ